MARPKYNLGSERPQTMTFTLSGLTLLAFGNALTFKQILPQRAKIIGMSMNAVAKGGTHSVSTVNVLAGATALIASPFDLAAHTPGTPVSKEGTALASAADEVAGDTEIRVTTAESGGTSPTVQGLIITIDYVPLGG